ncbi:MAG TPA: hypothetical protein VN289_17410 [Paraburkholderia sp.]|jgi:hypothetical protein|nr:hypothetical protein [Paraburkholderia sp.]
MIALRNKHRASARFGVSCAVASLLTACGALPDASGFAAAGAQLHSAVIVTGDVLVDELQRAELGDESRDMEKLWKVPDACTLAMKNYGDAIASIVQVSRDSGAAAEQVAQAGATFANSIGAVLPPVLASAEAARLAGTVVQQIQNERAARSLEAALSDMQPTVDLVAGLLDKQLHDADDILLDASGLIYTGIVQNYQQEISYSKTLTDARRTLYTRAISTDTTRQLDDISRREQSIAPSLKQYAQEKTANEQRWKTQHELLIAARQAVQEWAGAHRQLLIAVQNRSAVDPRALNESIVELRALLRKARMS